jgi:hypothetical protein
MVRPPTKVFWKDPSFVEDVGGNIYTNFQVGVKLVISNSLDSAYLAHAPYTLRGVEPGSSSAENSSNWTSATFKVTGYLNNGRDAYKPEGMVWMPLRYFVFDESSFDSDFTAIVEIDDPFLPPSPTYYQGWSKYLGDSVFFSWDIDARIAPVSPEVLRPMSVYE